MAVGAVDSVKRLFEEFERDIAKLTISTTQVENRLNQVPVSSARARSSLPSMYTRRNPETYLDLLRQHFEYFERQLVFSSSPQAFKLAWDLRSKDLSLHDAEKILSLGGSLTPQMEEFGLFRYSQNGLIIGKAHKGFLLGIRHSAGNYNDALNELGQFTYQPPENLLGMLRYRFYEYFEEILKVPYMLFVSMWFAYNNSYQSDITSWLPDESNWLYVVTPVKVISQHKLSDDSLHRPLKLQAITRDEAFQIARQFKGLSHQDLETEFRPTLRDGLAREFSYEHIKNSAKGAAIKKWAKDAGRSCPECQKSFSSKLPRQLHFGHILSQKWCSSFGYLQDSVHYPDNLYLTCHSCNSSLGQDFPSLETRKRIVSPEYGTIGDWLRTHESDIRKRIKQNNPP